MSKKKLRLLEQKNSLIFGVSQSREDRKMEKNIWFTTEALLGEGW